MKSYQPKVQLYRIYLTFFFKTKRPQYYFYPYKKLETNKRLEKVEELKNSATDGEEVYYAGEKLVNADI